ncbi:MAG: hypothetical protein LBD73_08560 [Deferribacteraceae bacterium]|jgi:hypothetical protein|nr:hypothetical protein [Deferribacteraceae bacterium]
MRHFNFFLILISVIISALLVSGCEKSDSDGGGDDGKYSSSCYSAKSDIYRSESVRYPQAGAASVSFNDDNGTEIADFRVSPEIGSYITLPDIHFSYCQYRKDDGRILTGWDDGTELFRPRERYQVNGSAVFSTVWEEGTEIYTATEFNNIRDNLSAIYKLMRDIDL